MHIAGASVARDRKRVSPGVARQRCSKRTHECGPASSTIRAVVPGRTAIDADLDPRDPAVTGPRVAGDRLLTRPRSRDPAAGDDDQRLDRHPRHRTGGRAGLVVEHVLLGVVVAVEGWSITSSPTIHLVEAIAPHPGTSNRTGPPCGAGRSCAVHLPGEHHIRVERRLDRQCRAASPRNRPPCETTSTAPSRMPGLLEDVSRARRRSTPRCRSRRCPSSCPRPAPGRSGKRLRLLPEHSRKAVIVRCGIALRSASDSSISRSTRPVTPQPPRRQGRCRPRPGPLERTKKRSFGVSRPSSRASGDS